MSSTKEGAIRVADSGSSGSRVDSSKCSDSGVKESIGGYSSPLAIGSFDIPGATKSMEAFSQKAEKDSSKSLLSSGCAEWVADKWWSLHENFFPDLLESLSPL
jgi:hypothetical protein